MKLVCYVTQEVVLSLPALAPRYSLPQKKMQFKTRKKIAYFIQSLTFPNFYAFVVQFVHLLWS